MPTTSNFGWTTPADTDLVKDGAAAIRTLGNGIDTSLVDLKGGTTGQILSKNSNTDLDYTWINNDQGDITEVQAGVGISVSSGTGPIPIITNSSTDLITTAGDILYGTAADTVARLGIGTVGQVLTVNSGATAPQWATPAGGKILQVVSAVTTTSTTIASTSYTDTTITASITPTAATSKILVISMGIASLQRSTNPQELSVKIVRGVTDVANWDWLQAINFTGVTAIANFGNNFNVTYLDSPASTSSLTYKLQGKVSYTANSGQVIFQNGSLPSSIILMEVGA